MSVMMRVEDGRLRNTLRRVATCAALNTLTADNGHGRQQPAWALIYGDVSGVIINIRGIVDRRTRDYRDCTKEQEVLHILEVVQTILGQHAQGTDRVIKRLRKVIADLLWEAHTIASENDRRL